MDEFRVPELEWSDAVLLCDAASTRPELASRLRDLRLASIHGSAYDDIAVSKALDDLRCRTPGRKRRLTRALVRKVESSSSAEKDAFLEALIPKATLVADYTLVCTHHKEGEQQK